ncbi:MAG: hypothetical protein U0L74_03255 [Paludibacteraceae bacterium]|nr:hypothetical protein [Paludibacteraceae bacterium]
MIKLVVIRSFKMKRFNVIGLLLFVLALASCSQKNAGTNDVVDAAVVPTDADSVVLANPVPKLADTIAVDSAEIDSFVAEDEIVKDSSDEYGGVQYRRLKFKIHSPLYQHFKEVDSIACSFNNWNYAPDAVYEVNITEFFDGEEVVVAYRNGIKVMESSEGEGEFRHYSKTYYYSDGSVADYEVSKEVDGKEFYFETSNTLSLFLSEDDQYFFVHLHKDTLSISEVVDYFSEEVINREVYLVADEGTPVPEIVVKAIKSERPYCEKLEKIKFVKKIEQ